MWKREVYEGGRDRVETNDGGTDGEEGNCWREWCVEVRR